MAKEKGGCIPGRPYYRDKEGTTVICIGNDVKTTVAYNPPTLLSSNNNSNTATYQPHTPSLGGGSLFGSSGSGYVGVAESYSMNNQYGGIHATGGGIHGKYVEPMPQQIQPVQIVAVNTNQPVVKQEVVIAKPVLTQKEIKAEEIARAQYYAIGVKADVKAKAITEMIIATQEEEHEKVLNLGNTVLTRADTNKLGGALAKVSFTLDVMSLENTKFASDTGLPDMLSLDHFMGIFHNLNQGISHNVVYLNMTNTCANFYTGDPLVQKISKALISGDLNATKAINLSGNKITDNAVNKIAEDLKSDNSKLEQLNLSGNKITDNGANSIAEALKTGKVNNLKYLDVSDNNITEKGEGFFVKAMSDKVVDHIIIITQKLDHTSKFFPGIGTKEEKIALYKEYLKQGVEKGTNDQGIVVDKSFWGEVKQVTNQFKAAWIGTNGFIKCNFQPDDVIESYAKETFVAKVSKTLGKVLGKLTMVNGVTSCYLQGIDEMYTAETGQKVLTHKLSILEENHELHVIGESEFSGEQ